MNNIRSIRYIKEGTVTPAHFVFNVDLKTGRSVDLEIVWDKLSKTGLLHHPHDGRVVEVSEAQLYHEGSIQGTLDEPVLHGGALIACYPVGHISLPVYPQAPTAQHTIQVSSSSEGNITLDVPIDTFAISEPKPVVPQEEEDEGVTIHPDEDEDPVPDDGRIPMPVPEAIKKVRGKKPTQPINNDHEDDGA